MGICALTRWGFLYEILSKKGGIYCEKQSSGSAFKCNTIVGALANNTQHTAYCYRFTPHGNAPPSVNGGRGTWFITDRIGS